MIRLELMNRQELRSDYKFAAYSYSLRTHVLGVHFGSGLDKNIDFYRLTEEEFNKYNTEEFDEIVKHVVCADRHIGVSPGMDAYCIELANDKWLSPVARNNLDQFIIRHIAQEYINFNKVGYKESTEKFYSVFYNKEFKKYIL